MSIRKFPKDLETSVDRQPPMSRNAALDLAALRFIPIQAAGGLRDLRQIGSSEFFGRGYSSTTVKWLDGRRLGRAALKQTGSRSQDMG